MDRCALFVDAGYLLADGAMAVHGTRHREAVSWDYPGLLQLMTGLSRERTGLPLLRCYWYEATVEGRRTPEHDALADIPGLKLRLSRIRPGRREGVDAQVHRDLMTLARNNAICDAVVVSGDEDLTQVVCDAQDLGIRVTVVHVATEGGWAVSRTLRQEGDDLIELGATHLRPYVSLVTGFSESNGHHQPLSNGHAASHAASHAATHALPPAPPPPSTSSAPGSLPASLPTPPQSTGSHAAPPRSAAHGSPAHEPSAPAHGSLPAGSSPGHSSPGHSSPAHDSPAHSPSGHSPSGHSPPGHSPSGHSSSGHSSSAHTPVHGSAAPAAPSGDSRPPAGQGPGSSPSALPSYYQQESPPATGSIQQQPQAPTTGQFTMPSANGTYQPAQLGAYTGPQPSPVPPAATSGATTLADAVKAAHREGHDFGESVARDAPALWLEAVLARKPRMPSDLEARLLQGSSLPIDFLLHDEVRHALRRGFWDALERARQ
ncbi:NYN domain-containing protein [Nonomuraea sp. NPDC047897]|uniref:NYN domain-containing protein n=1 Tax=Nonomuraea sp. NPDC047897 TaxID=3364346 RepID=UPI00371A794F